MRPQQPLRATPTTPTEQRYQSRATTYVRRPLRALTINDIQVPVQPLPVAVPRVSIAVTSEPIVAVLSVAPQPEPISGLDTVVQSTPMPEQTVADIPHLDLKLPPAPQSFLRRRYALVGMASLVLLVGISIAMLTMTRGGHHVAAQAEQNHPIVTPVTIAPTPTVPDLPSDATAGTTPKSY